MSISSTIAASGTFPRAHCPQRHQSGNWLCLMHSDSKNLVLDENGTAVAKDRWCVPSRSPPLVVKPSSSLADGAPASLSTDTDASAYSGPRATAKKRTPMRRKRRRKRKKKKNLKRTPRVLPKPRLSSAAQSVQSSRSRRRLQP